ncbi:hypothetical protein LJR118_000592 [Acidovorax sp. LjRoot118]|uniref:hypothetical protein n=1 Tax=Acidovorax sp. LjRoot118 TaxID=3342256 RepID=UPI003ED0D610
MRKLDVASATGGALLAVVAHWQAHGALSLWSILGVGLGISAAFFIRQEWARARSARAADAAALLAEVKAMRELLEEQQRTRALTAGLF